MRNLEIAKLLRSVAAALTLKPGDNRFRIVAYERAADAVEHSSSEIKDLWDEGELGTLAGVGESIASHLDELFRTGKVKHFDQVFKGIPEAVFELMDISGIGPKNALKLSRELGITRAHSAVEKLEKAATKGHIQKLEGFGEDSEKNILESIAIWKNKSTRVLLNTAQEAADSITVWLKTIPEVKSIDPLGSLRRRASTVGDVDIAVASDNPKAVIDRFISYPYKSRVIEAGEMSASINLPNGLQVDLMVQPQSHFGALLQHFTGSKHHNIALRELAQRKGLSLSEKGIKRGGLLRQYSTEESFYQALGMDWIPPELREGNGEIEAAIKHYLPKLIKPSEIKGDLHTHSDFPIEPSHDLGTSSMVQMITSAQELGYQYLGFTEHNPSLSGHTKDQVIDLLKRKNSAIEQLKDSTKNRGINLLNGLEIDIRPDGSLALPDEGFDYLDYAIVSIHNSFKGPKSDQTKRVLKALAHPKVKILGHPTARILGEREGVDLDWDSIFDLCLKQNKFLEINASPNRLDLPDVLVREAVKLGVKLVIDTDSHAADSMTLMPYGVSVARRGWSIASDIINTLPWEKFIKTFLG